jgi:hypothetical protein
MMTMEVCCLTIDHGLLWWCLHNQKKNGHLQLSHHNDDQCCLVLTQNENKDHEHNFKNGNGLPHVRSRSTRQTWNGL